MRREKGVRASSHEGARVIDPFCGSGTTLLAAAKLGRRFAGGDVGELALEATTARLAGEGVAFDLRVESSSCPASTTKRAFTPCS